jgi:hypothetical protein
LEIASVGRWGRSPRLPNCSSLESEGRPLRYFQCVYPAFLSFLSFLIEEHAVLGRHVSVDPVDFPAEAPAVDRT